MQKKGKIQSLQSPRRFRCPLSFHVEGAWRRQDTTVMGSHLNAIGLGADSPAGTLPFAFGCLRWRWARAAIALSGCLSRHSSGQMSTWG